MKDKPAGPFFFFRAAALFFFLPLLFVPQAWANVLGNPGFESGIGNGTGGNWDNTNNAVRTTPGDGVYPIGFSAPPEGNFALFLDVAADFTFQTYDLVQPGDFVSFSGLAQSDVAAGSGGQFRIEFKRKNDDGTDSLISAIDSALINAGNAPPPGAFVRFTISGTAPPETGRVVFVIRRQGAAVGDSLFDFVNGEVNPAKLTVSASKNRVKKGDIVTIYARFRNTSGDALNNVQLRTEIPAGIDILTSTVRLDGRTVPIQEGSLIIPINSIAAGQSMEASFQVAVTGGVTVGKEYDLGIVVKDDAQLSESRRVRLIVEDDPVFDQGTIIGKVFNDANQNGVQDPGEKGVPWVRLATEEGIVIITDEHGKYHIPGVKPGRHVIKIDGHALPAGTRFVTEESYLTKVTAGLMSKVNFAVLLPPSAIPENFKEDLMVWITQGLDTSKPVLDVSMEPSNLKAGLGILQKEPVFKLNNNYPDFVKSWYLEIRDELGTEIWSGYGVSNPPAEVTWTGKANDGFLIKPGVYSYRFKVEDASGRQDWTPLHFFRVGASGDGKEVGDKEPVDLDPIGDFNIFKDGKRSIPLVAKPTLRIQGKTKPKHKITINGNPIVADGTGSFKAEIYVSPGDKEVEVTSTSPEGESTTHREVVKVKDSTFFMVALGEEQLGYNIQGGNIETAGREEEFKEGFYQNGRLSYYLRGKLKGKFLYKSHYDTSDKRSALFTNLDPEQYYPVYGDASTRDYEGQDTRQRFFIVVEMDRSYVKWGSFKTEFTDTELGSYNRTLSGLKLHHETLSSTKYGDSTRGFKLFWTKADYRGDHNEFAATGGSLYYLRNRRVIEGSEKMRVEVRDKLQDIAIASYDLKEGMDYEIDYNDGRIMLTRPLSSVSASDTLVSKSALDGNPVYLIVDYEFQGNPDTFSNSNRGIRGYTHLGDHIRIGGTAVEEVRQNANYNLRAVDVTVKAGRNTRVTAEYAQSENQQVNQSISYNGGLTFSDRTLLVKRSTPEGAYLIKAESKPFKTFDVSGYVQGMEPGFSNDRSVSQDGLTKYGVGARFKPADEFQVRYRYDVSNLRTQLQPVDIRNVLVPYNERGTHTVQATYDDKKWLAQAEYLKQNIQLPSTNLRPTLDSVFDFQNGVAGKLGYHLNDRLLPYAKVQVTMNKDEDNLFGGGVRYEILRDVFGYVEQMFGRTGDSTYFGFEKIHSAGSRSYANLRMRDRSTLGARTLATAIGSTYALSERSRIYSEREYSTYQGVDGYADILGYDGRLNDRWGFETKFERRNLSSANSSLLEAEADSGYIRANTFNAVSGGVSYANGEKLRARSFVEVRRDQEAPRMWQWVLRDSLDYKINQDLSFLTKFDFGYSRFSEPNGTPAFFAELNTGFAYRPVDFDRLNVLTRYTYLKDIANDIQFATDLYEGMPTDETAHIIAIDLAYDLYKYLGLADKFAYKRGGFKAAASDEMIVNTFLAVNRFNFHVTRKWDLALEYRALIQAEAAKSLRHGPLVEIDREFYEYVRLGLGYNFTDFDDDLRSNNDYYSNGFFVRMSGKF